MLKGNLLKVIGETAQGSNLTRLEKFEVFCRVCDNMLAEGRISKVQHERWTNVFWRVYVIVSPDARPPLQPVGEVVHVRFPDPSHAL